MAQITLNSTGVASNGSLVLQSNGTTTAVTIDTSQNVGIGTGSPLGKLQVKGANPQIFMEDSAGGTNGKFTAIGTSNGNMTFNRYLDNGTLFGQFMTLDASGNLGIGATSPTQKLQVAGKIAVSGTNPSIQQTVQNAFLDLCGGTTIGTDPAIQIAGSTTTSDANKIFYNANTHLFRTTSGGTTYATIDTSGNLLVGKTSSSATTGDGFGFSNDGQGHAVSAYTTNAAYTWRVYSTGAAAYRFYVGYGGTVYATSTTITAISDQRLKENIRDLDDGLDVVMALKPRKFDWKEGKGADIKNARGFIAQEFEAVLPDMIEEWADPAPEGEEPYKAINANLIPTLVKAIQELKAEFDAYKASHP